MKNFKGKTLLTIFFMLFALTLSSCSVEPVVGPQGEIGLTGEKGEDGLTPYIGDNGNWWIGETDTGFSASAQKAKLVNKAIKVIKVTKVKPEKKVIKVFLDKMAILLTLKMAPGG